MTEPGAEPADACTLAYISDANLLRVTLRGEMALDALVACAGRAFAEAARHGCTAILLDARAMRMLLTPADIYWLPGRFEEVGLEPHHRLAFLHSSRTAAPMDVLLGDNVFANRGHAVRAFADEDRALTWLARREAH